MFNEERHLRIGKFYQICILHLTQKCILHKILQAISINQKLHIYVKETTRVFALAFTKM